MYDGGSIDIVEIVNTETGISHVAAPLHQLDEARKVAAEMSEYHERRYEARTRSVKKALYPHLANGGRVEIVSHRR